MHTTNTKKLKAEIKQSLTTAALALFETDEWCNATKPGADVVLKALIDACAANLAQGLSDRVVACCDFCGGLTDDDAKVARNGDLECWPCQEKRLDKAMGLDPMDLAKIKAGF